MRAIIEIELSSQPKHLLGVALANSLAEFGRFNDSFKIDKFDLFIIVDSEPIEKDGSSKPEQIKAIESEVNRIFRGMCKESRKVGIFNIMTDKNFEESFDKAFKGEILCI